MLHLRQEIHRLARGAAFLLGILALGACDQELPTDVGGEHLPESSLRTYEILLDDEIFLLSDSVLRGFGTSNLSNILLVAEDYGGILDSHALVQFGDFPITVTYADSSETQTDTVIAFTEGRIVLRVDTLRLDTLSAADSAITFEMYTVGEPFDVRTATWRAREVAGDDSVFWTTPGGTEGELIASRTWVRGDSVIGDSVSFAVDSAIVAAWATAEDDLRGILIRTTTSGARAQVVVPRLELRARLQNDEDTTRVTSAVVTGQTYLYDPPPPAPLAELRVGDRSAWRSFLTFAPGLDSLEIPCPDEPGCTFLLGDVAVNRAELRLLTLEVPEVYRPRNNLAIEARPVLGLESVPLSRAPLGDTTGVAFTIEPISFAADADSTVRIGVTRFLRVLLARDSTFTDRERTLAILTAPEPISFGIARFGGFGTEHAPVLRIIVTLPPREEEE